MSRQIIWRGSCGSQGHDTQIYMDSAGVWLFQEGADGDGRDDYLTLHPNEAIDIAFAILRELAPTIHETLEKIHVES